MGSCCTSRKEIKYEDFSNGIATKKIRSNLKSKIFLEDYKTDEIIENYITEIYSYANINQDLNTFIALLDNNSKINVESNFLKTYSWISEPKSLGDAVIMKILGIVEKNFYIFQFESRINFIDTESTDNFSCNSSKSSYNIQENENLSLKRERMIVDIEKNDLINKLFWLLLNGSNTKRDCSILILIKLTYNKKLSILMSNKATIKLLIHHINTFKTIKYKNFKEHVIATLELLRIIYLNNIELRKFFVSCKGLDLLYELINIWDFEILHDILMNFEYLIFRSEEKYNSISKIVNYEMIEILSNAKFETKLREISNEILKNIDNHENTLEIIDTLTSAFYKRDLIGNSINVVQSSEFY